MKFEADCRTCAFNPFKSDECKICNNYDNWLDKWDHPEETKLANDNKVMTPEEFEITNTEDVLLVGFDFTHGRDITALTVGRKKRGKVIEIINTFIGQEAEDLYKKLTTRKLPEKIQRSSFVKDGKE